MKILVLVFGALGLALELTHFGTVAHLARHPLADHALGLVMLAGFGVPVLVSAIDRARPLGAGAYLLAAGCFAAVFVRLKMWDELTRFADLALRDKLYFAAALGGAAVAAIVAIAGRRR